MAVLSNLDLLRRVPMFSALTPGQMVRLSDSVQKRRFKRGELIVEQGKKSNALFLLLTGRARVVMVDERGREVILATLGAGDYVGEISLIDGKSHSANVQAEEITDVLVLDSAAFEACLHENFTLARGVIRGLAERLRKADEQIGALALMDVYGRVAGVLETIAELDANQQWVLRGKLSRQDIAKKVGASREMVSRVMRDFEDRGVIRTEPDGRVLLLQRGTGAAPKPDIKKPDLNPDPL